MTRPKPPRKTAERGYGSDHQKLRKHWQRYVAMGQAICVRCGRSIPPAGLGPCPAIRDGKRCGKNHRGWDLGHDDFDRSRHTGPEHVCCNRATAGRRSRRRKRIVGHVREVLRQSREW